MKSSILVYKKIDNPMVKMKMKFYKPNDGIYKVKMHLDKEDSSRIRDILDPEPEFTKVCGIKRNILEYKSETVLPLDDISSKCSGTSIRN